MPPTNRSGGHRGWDDAFLIDGGYLQRDPIITHKAGSGQVEGWTAEILTDRAVEFIRTAGDAPWFMTVAHIIPHLPWICEERFSVPFRDQGLSPELAVCYGSIAQLDEAVGRLPAGLKQAGQDSRTIVVFVSDNGMTDKDSASKPFSPEDCKRRNIHHIRGQRIEVHSLPGGATALFDLAADPGETGRRFRHVPRHRQETCPGMPATLGRGPCQWAGIRHADPPRG